MYNYAFRKVTQLTVLQCILTYCDLIKQSRVQGYGAKTCLLKRQFYTGIKYTLFNYYLLLKSW